MCVWFFVKRCIASSSRTSAGVHQLQNGSHAAAAHTVHSCLHLSAAPATPAVPSPLSQNNQLHTEDAESWKEKGEAVILCRQETSPEDVGGMHAAEGILTSRGGMTSHAAVVARGWGKPCCCGCEELIVDSFAKTLKAPVSVFAVSALFGLCCVHTQIHIHTQQQPA